MINLYLNELRKQIKEEDAHNEARRKDDAKKNKCSEERLEALMTNYALKADTIILDYVRPSAELIGLIENNWRMNKFQFVYVGTIRSINDSQDSESTATQMKQVHTKHSACFLQRIETMLNAFLLLSYEKAGENFIEDNLILSRKVAELYMNTLRRYAANKVTSTHIIMVVPSSRIGTQIAGKNGPKLQQRPTENRPNYRT